MQPSAELIDQLWWDKVEQARRMTPDQRLAAGPELFDDACEVTKAGIRMDNPHFTEAEVLRELKRRLALVERWR